MKKFFLNHAEALGFLDEQKKRFEAKIKVSDQGNGWDVHWHKPNRHFDTQSEADSFAITQKKKYFNVKVQQITRTKKWQVSWCWS